jgi:hypothetical protein
MSHPQALVQAGAAVRIAPDLALKTRVLPVWRVWLLVAVLVGSAWLVSLGKLYTPGSDFGYYIGLVGGVMMLTLLLYPLRKHVRFMSALGATRHWFKLHMFFGIAGPTLILYHSTFNLGSLNATVALICMLLVAGSGVIGRFIYTRIHHGLYGRRATLQEAQARLGICEGEVKSKFHFAPKVEQRLKTFEAQALDHSGGFVQHAWGFMSLGSRALWVRWLCRRELRQVLAQHAEQRQWPPGKLAARLAAADDRIVTFLESVRRVSQFNTYERLFSLWHILHVPFVYMLVISGVIHVIAVHMY